MLEVEKRQARREAKTISQQIADYKVHRAVWEARTSAYRVALGKLEEAGLKETQVYADIDQFMQYSAENWQGCENVLSNLGDQLVVAIEKSR